MRVSWCAEDANVPVGAFAVAVGDEVGLPGHLVLITTNGAADRGQVNALLAGLNHLDGFFGFGDGFLEGVWRGHVEIHGFGEEVFHLGDGVGPEDKYGSAPILGVNDELTLAAEVAFECYEYVGVTKIVYEIDRGIEGAGGLAQAVLGDTIGKNVEGPG